jgi:rhodanese-related sulfurtransferase
MIINLAFAGLEHKWVTKEFLEKNKNMKIIDVRTPGEWVETGIVKGSHTIMFFNEQGQFNVPKFLDALNKVVKKDEKFALICRTGSRTFEISKFLAYKLGYDVVNLAGGIEKLMKEGYQPVPYISPKK